jgi:exopolysaccharide production protein ExoQ
VEDFTTNVLGKDPTLTGRTVLWAKADELIEEAPLLGHGFETIWSGSSPTTIGLLRWAGLRDGKGFHFHNQVRELWTQLGVVGVLLYIGVALFTAFNLARALLLDPSPTTSFLSITFFVLMLRSATEVLISAFSIDTFLWVAIAAYSQALVAGRTREQRPVEPRLTRSPGPVRDKPRQQVRTFRH